MQITESHETWWRTEGQFLEPAGNIQDTQTLDLLKQHSQSARAESLEDLETKLEAERDSMEDDFRKVKDEIKAVIKSRRSAAEKLVEIQDILDEDDEA